METAITLGLGTVTMLIAIFKAKIKPNPTKDSAIAKKNKKADDLIKALKAVSAGLTAWISPEQDEV